MGDSTSTDLASAAFSHHTGINLGALTDLSDALVFVVAIPNLVGLYLMAPIVRRELARYRPPARLSR